jgi:hypothetical protein
MSLTERATRSMGCTSIRTEAWPGVVPAWKITELLQDEELEQIREERREEIKRQREDATLDSAGEERPE